jgi:hypothetical protein
MALSDTALISLATARSLVSGLPSVDADLEQLIEAASRIANRYARRHLAATNYTERLSGYGGDALLLRQRPVQSITSVHIDSNRLFGNDTAVTDYEADTPAGILYRYSGWTRGRRNIQVVYRAGYELASVPEDLQGAVANVAYWLYRRVQENAIGIRSITSPDGINTAIDLSIPLASRQIFEGDPEVLV